MDLSAYDIDQENGIILSEFVNITDTMTVQDFLGNIVKGHQAQTLKIFRAGKSSTGGDTPKTGTETLTDNDMLEVTAENGNVKQYTIKLNQ